MVEIIILLIASLIVLSTAIPSIDYCSSVYCPTAKHTACNNTGKFSPTKCAADIKVRKLSPSLKQFLVDLHNEYRMTIANGLQPLTPGATQYFPSARQMMKLVWDEQEAWMSYLQLITCLSHDACHNTAFNSSNGRLLLSGQNIFTFYKTGERYDLKLYLELAVYNWFNEYQVTRLSEIDSLTFTANNFTIGHFTQMIHDKSVLFGCSVVEWTEDNGNKKFTRVSCDYQKANYAYKPVYERGIACSGCAVCDEDDFYGLCLA